MKHPLIAPIMSFLTGIIVASIVPATPFSILISCMSGIILLLIATRKNTHLFYIVFCIFFLFLGLFRYATFVHPAKNDISKYISTEKTKSLVYGTIISTLEIKGDAFYRHIEYILRVHKILLNGKEQDVTGNILVKSYKKDSFPVIGEDVVISGGIFIPEDRNNPYVFNYKNYLLNGGVKALLSVPEGASYFQTGVTNTPVIRLKRELGRIRKKADTIIGKYLQGTPGAVTRSVVLGLRDQLPEGVKTLFMKTGTMHILAVSGLHIGIVAFIFTGLFRILRVPMRTAYILTILSVLIFAVFTGARPSSIRAAIMTSFVLAGLLSGRKVVIIDTLFLSAFFITFFNPGQLFSPGFILSYSAVLCIIYLTPFTDAFFKIEKRTLNSSKIKIVGIYFMKSVSVSFAIWLGMMPLAAVYFNILTPVVVIANLIAIPALFITVIMGFSLLISGILHLFSAAKVSAFLLEKIVNIFSGVTAVMSEIPFSNIYVRPPGTGVLIIFYLVLTAGVFVFKRKNKLKLFVIYLLLAEANLFVWNEAVAGPPDNITAVFFNVGKADAACIEFPDGSVMLIDAGSGGREGKADAVKNVIEPYLRQRGIRRIDCVVMTHPHEDHIGGFKNILEKFVIGTVIDGDTFIVHGAEKEAYEDILSTIKKKRIRYLKVKRGDKIKGIPGADILILNPPLNMYRELNNDSIVLKVRSDDGGSIIFCADAGSVAMKDMLRFGNMLKSDIIKVPHHGGEIGEMDIAEIFIKKIDPKIAIVTNIDVKNDALSNLFDKKSIKCYTTGRKGLIFTEDKEGRFIMEN